MAIDDALFKELLASTTAPTASPQGTVEQQPSSPPTQQPRQATPASMEDLSKPGRDAIGKPSDFLDAAVAGAGRAALETKDFVVGEPETKSETRQAFEKGAKAADDGGPLNPVVSTISQWTTGMLGLGKIAQGARVASGVVDAALGAAGTIRTSMAGAAAVGAVAFDPHQERLSNLLEQVPVIGGPMFGWLAAHPGDAAWEGRTKAALESIGLDAVLGAAFLAGAKLLKAMRSGDQEAVAAATKELEAAEAAMTPAETPPGGDVYPGPPGARTATEAPPAAPTALRPQDQTLIDPPDPVAILSREEDAIHAKHRLDIVEEQHGYGSPEWESAHEALQRDLDQFALRTGGKLDPETHRAAAMEGANDNVLGGPPLDKPGTPPLSITPAQPKGPVVTVSPEEAEKLVAGVRFDLEAIDRAGSLQGAVDEGHVFGRGSNIPWNKLNLPGEVDDFVARVADSIEGQADRLKGGAILEDARVHRQINGIASYFNMDPGTIVGRIQQSGQAASRMVADMEAAYLISHRMHQEAFNLANRITLGDFGALGSREAAMAEFQRQVTLAGSMLASGQSMRAAMGRGLRRLRPEFAIDTELVERVNGLGGDKLLKLFTETAGDPDKLRRITQKSFLAKAMDEVGFLVQNNLLWGYGTHVVNFLSNAYMLAGRPTEKAIGGLVRGDTAMAKEALVQASYYPAAIVDGFSSVVQALKNSESVIDPRHTALVLESRSMAIRDGAFRSMDSLAGVLHNAYLMVALPTRLLTGSDEMMKQVVYRSHVSARAYGEGVEAGLRGKDLSRFVKDKLSGAFDDSGRAIDEAAIQEARVSTFSQDLTPTGWGDIPTAGRTLRAAVGMFPPLRLVLPFTQTPTNLFRYTVKLTPGFNLMQQEFNHAIRGKFGAEAQAQAIGQMSLGSLMLGAISMSSLNMTGGGPSDPKVRAEKMATGWRPYSLAVQDDDGAVTYYPVGRVDPIALPFGIVADIQDYMHATGEGEESSKVQAAISTLAYSLVKQVSNKTYLQGIAKATQAWSDPKQHLNRFLASTTMELVPFSSALRNYNPDPYLREARDYVDNLMASVPGLSEGLNPRRDWAGDPIRDRTAFLSVSPGDPVTREMNRMQSLGYSLVPPTPVMRHADLREVTMADGKNAWDVYQQLAGKPTSRSPSLREQVGKIIDTPAYRRAPDGPVDVPGTKLFLLHGPVVAYRRSAEALLLRDDNVRKAVLSAQQKVVDAYKAQEAPGTPPKVEGAREALGAVGRAFGINLGTGDRQ